MYYFAQNLIDGKSLPHAPTTQDSLTHILTIFFTILGAIALLMLVIAGLRYVLTQGDPNKTAEVRRQIIYIAIGLVVVAVADAIVTFIVGRASQ